MKISSSLKMAGSALLSDIIQYYYFLHTVRGENFYYQTFPNTNLCLSLYRQNCIEAEDCDTHTECRVKPGNTFTSRLWGFHEKPFQVSVEEEMDQVFIVFHPGGLRHFTNIPYEYLLNNSQVFQTIFGNSSLFFLEILFNTNDDKKRSVLLNRFLINQVKNDCTKKNLQNYISQLNHSEQNISVDEMAEELNLSSASLYRHFIRYVGQPPKTFLQTIRFRKALRLMQEHNYSNFTGLSYASDYFDQSHFIKDFKRFSGLAPGELTKKISLEKQRIVWIVKNSR